MRERAGEMSEKTLLRRQWDRICKESTRASETCEESSERREQNRTRERLKRVRRLQRDESRTEHV